jgi:hypothetical protein
MVGSISITVDTSTITSTPPGLRASNWFGYTGGYNAVSQIVPGKAYWVKANQAGTFLFDEPADAGQSVAESTPLSELFNTLTVSDRSGASQTLLFGMDENDAVPTAMFAMPPAPPEGAFDARFESSEGGLMLQKHGRRTEALSFPITIRTSSYPVTLAWKMHSGLDRTYTLTDAAGGSAVASTLLRGEGSLQIGNPSAGHLVLKVSGGREVPVQFALEQNYPNPFNPTTNIRFALPVQSKVVVEIYNVLGQRVKTLLREDRSEGYHTIEWNGTGNQGQQLGSGVYFLQLSASGADGKTFKDVRKLMMLK